MKPRKMFCLSLLLVGLALVLAFMGRGELNQAFQAWHRGDREVFRQFAKSGAMFIYPAWALALGAAACLLISYRRHEPAWRWTVVLLLAVFLFLGLAPG